MSGVIVNRVLRDSDTESALRLVLLILAYQAGDDGTATIRPGKVAELSRLSEKQALAAIRLLEQGGHIKTAGTHTAAIRYLVLYPSQSTPPGVPLAVSL